MKKKTIANKGKISEKSLANLKPWPKGVSGNPKGRPKDGESWAAIIKAVGDMFPEDIIEFIGNDNPLGREIAKFPKSVQMKYLVAARIFAALMFEPSGSLWKELMERTEGKVAQPIEHSGKIGLWSNFVGSDEDPDPQADSE